jgi:hypothetical protein
MSLARPCANLWMAAVRPNVTLQILSLPRRRSATTVKRAWAFSAGAVPERRSVGQWGLLASRDVAVSQIPQAKAGMVASMVLNS